MCVWMLLEQSMSTCMFVHYGQDICCMLRPFSFIVCKFCLLLWTVLPQTVSRPLFAAVTELPLGAVSLWHCQRQKWCQSWKVWTEIIIDPACFATCRFYVCCLFFILTSLRKSAEQFETLLGPAPPTRLIMTIDNRLRKQIQELHVRFQKVRV